jgi:uncharacterized protein with HEPN domain
LRSSTPDTKNFRENYPDFPWRETSSLRNVIAHEYFGLDTDIIWDVVQTRVPLLAEQLKQIDVDHPK